MVLPFTKVPRQTHEKEAGGGGVTTQAGRMQQCTAQGSPGKVGGVHGRWDLRASPTRSANGCIVFIMRVSFGCCVFGCNARSMLRTGRAVCYGVFTPCGSSLAPWGRDGPCGCGREWHYPTGRVKATAPGTSCESGMGVSPPEVSRSEGETAESHQTMFNPTRPLTIPKVVKKEPRRKSPLAPGFLAREGVAWLRKLAEVCPSSVA